MRKFLITNHYNMQNMGEVLQLQALKEGMPEDYFTIQGLYSFIDKELCRKMNIDYVGTTRPQSIPKMALTITKLAVKALINDIYNNYDMVIDLGGDTFTDKPNVKYAIMHSLTLLPFAVARKPYIICSQSIGPFGSITKPLAKFILRRASAITVRETTSQKYLSDLGIKSELCPDLAFLVKHPPSPKTASSLIGLNPSAIAPTRMSISLDEYADMISGLVRKLNANEVILIPHVYGPKKGVGSISNTDDREVIKRIAKKTGVRIGTHEDISRCSLFIGFRMHACIRAISLGIPTVAVGYSHKVKSLPEFAWIKTLDIKTLTLKSVLDAVSELKRAKVNRAELKAFTVKASGNIDAINRAHHERTERLIGSYIKCYVGYSTRPTIRQKAASGGVAKALAVAGNLETVTLKPNGLKPTTTLCEDASKLPQGSIYSFNTELAKEMCNTKAEAVVGVPCQIKAIKKAHPEMLCIGLFCSHRIEREGMELLLRHLKLEGNKIEYRAKVGGDTGMLIDDELFIPTKKYWKRFFNYTFIPEQCLRCLGLTNEEADVSLGDAWNIMKDANVVITRTKEGEELLHKALANDLLTIEEINVQRIISSQNYIGVKKEPKNLQFAVYRLLRAIGNYISHKPLLYPILHLWIHIIMLTIPQDVREGR